MEARGRLRVTASATFGERYLGPVIDSYLHAHPGVEVEVMLADRYVDIVQEGFDLAFRAGAVGDESLVAREIGRAQLHCYASPAYLAGRKRPRRPADLAGHECILYPPLARGGRWVFRLNGRATNVSVRGRLVVNSMPLSLDAAVRAAGIARLPADFVLEHVRRGELVAVLSAFALPPSPMLLVYPRTAHTPPRVRAFVEVAVNHLSAMSWFTTPARRP